MSYRKKAVVCAIIGGIVYFIMGIAENVLTTTRAMQLGTYVSTPILSAEQIVLRVGDTFIMLNIGMKGMAFFGMNTQVRKQRQENMQKRWPL